MAGYYALVRWPWPAVLLGTSAAHVRGADRSAAVATLSGCSAEGEPTLRNLFFHRPAGPTAMGSTPDLGTTTGPSPTSEESETRPDPMEERAW